MNATGPDFESGPVVFLADILFTAYVIGQSIRKLGLPGWLGKASPRRREEREAFEILGVRLPRIFLRGCVFAVRFPPKSGEPEKF
ncbi:MAG TPA: hypothetical protein VIK33_17815 [Anaerolineae bacterium]